MEDLCSSLEALKVYASSETSDDGNHSNGDSHDDDADAENAGEKCDDDHPPTIDDDNDDTSKCDDGDVHHSIFTGAPIPRTKSRYYEIYNIRKALPVWVVRERLMEALARTQVVVLTGETGSGKTTQIPQWCWEYIRDHQSTHRSEENDVKDGEHEVSAGAGANDEDTNATASSPSIDAGEMKDTSVDGERAMASVDDLVSGMANLRVSGPTLMVACTQPRRVAAVAAARRVAEECGEVSGSQGAVGHKVRFDDGTGPSTRIKFLTDGMLLQELAHCDGLDSYGCVILDEAHERSLATDVLFGVLKRELCHRPNLRVVVMSATLHAEKFRDFFLGDQKKRESHGKPHGINIDDDETKSRDARGTDGSVDGKSNGKSNGIEDDGAGEGEDGEGEDEEGEDGEGEDEEGEDGEGEDEEGEDEEERVGDDKPMIGGAVQTHQSPSFVATDQMEDSGPSIPIFHVKGRVHPVKILHTLEPVRNYLDAAVASVLQIHWYQPPGDILLFLTGRADIEDACKQLRKAAENVPEDEIAFDGVSLRGKGRVGSGWHPPGHLQVLPLYSSLPQDQQRKVWDPPLPPPGRRVVVATNIAETSLTLDNIVYVVDPGFSKQKVYNPHQRMESLVVAPISKANATQRAGRAGRVCPGTCFRLYTRETYAELLPQPHPEIEVSNLAGVVLRLADLGIHDLLRFPYVDPPTPQALMRALECLHHLGALSHDGTLTPQGRRMARFPLDPCTTRMVLEGVVQGCSNELLSIAAMLSAPPVWVLPGKSLGPAKAAHSRFAHLDGDHLTLLNVYHAYKNASGGYQWCYDHYLNYRSLQEAERIRAQLARVMCSLGLPLVSPPFGDTSECPTRKAYYAAIRRAVLGGSRMQVAYLDRAGHYVCLPEAEHAVLLHPSCSLRDKPTWVVFHESILTSMRYIRCVTRISPRWLVNAGLPFPLNAVKHSKARSALHGMVAKKANRGVTGK